MARRYSSHGSERSAPQGESPSSHESERSAPQPVGGESDGVDDVSPNPMSRSVCKGSSPKPMLMVVCAPISSPKVTARPVIRTMYMIPGQHTCITAKGNSTISKSFAEAHV